MSNQFYTVEDAGMNEFYQLPKALIKNKAYKDLSSNALVAYAILRDRHTLSLKNRWIDKENRVFFFFKDQDLAEILETSIVTAKRIKKQLKEHGLIHVQTQGAKRPSMIYLMKPEPPEISEVSKMTPHEVSKMIPHMEVSKMIPPLSKNESIYNKKSNNQNLSAKQEIEKTELPVLLQKRLRKKDMIDRLILLSSKLSINLENLLQDIDDLHTSFKDLLTTEQFTSCLVDSLNANISKNAKEYIRSALNKKYDYLQAKEQKPSTSTLKRKENNPEWFEKLKQEEKQKEHQEKIITNDQKPKEDVSDLLKAYNEKKGKHVNE